MSVREPIRVMIVEDHPMMALGLRVMLEKEGLVVCAEVGSIEAALHHPTLATVGLVMVDLSLGAEDGLDLVRHLIRDRPRLPLLVYSSFEDSVHIDRVLKAGAKCYLTKGETFEALIGAVRACLAGFRYLSPIAERNWIHSAESRRGLDALSAQEQKVYALLGQSFSTTGIAEELVLSRRTVESYFARIQVKLGLAGMKELHQRAMVHPL